MKTPNDIELKTNPENTESVAGAGCPASPCSAIHIDGKPGAKIDPVTEASIRKMEGLLHKKELIRKGNAGVNANGQIVDIREESGAVPVPPHKWADHVLPNASDQLPRP